MADHTYSFMSKPGQDIKDLTSAITNLNDSRPTTSFNTNKLFENLDDEEENLYYDEYDDSDKDPDYEPPVQTLEVSCEEMIDTPDCLNDKQDVLVQNVVDEDEVDEDLVDEAEGNTRIKKRKMTTSEKHDRNNILKEINIKKQKDKHPVIQKPCIGKCKKLCNLLTHEHQTTIWLDFWKLNYTERRKYMSKCVNITNIKRRKVVADINDGFRKNKSRIYTLSHPEFKVEIAVCKTTFLQTLGFTNDSVVTELVAVMEKDSCGQFVKENRGRPRIDII